MADVEAPPFTDEQVDIIAQVIADLRAEWQSDLAQAVDRIVIQVMDRLRDQMDIHQSIGELRGQLAMLTGNSIEASEIVRKLKVTKRE
jgi:hypothetical protein